MRRITGTAVIALGLLLSGCAGSIKNMRAVPDDAPAATPRAGEALVVFLRPSGIGFRAESSVFDIVDNRPRLVGIVAAKAKVAYRTRPGRHLFMSLSENADFMSAELADGKTYYVYVSPRMGNLKSHFVLEPQTRLDLEEPKLQSDLANCRWVELSAESEKWQTDNFYRIEGKRSEYYPAWRSKPGSEKAQLNAADGR